MRRIDQPQKLKKYIDQYQLQQIFSFDLEKAAHLVAYDINETIIQTHEKSNDFLILVEGECIAFTLTAEDQIHCERYFRPVDIMGLVAVIWGSEAINDIQTLTPSLFIAIPMEEYRNILLEDVKFLRFAVAYLAKHIRENSRQFEPLQTRLANFILKMEKDNLFQRNLTLTANLLGTSYRHLLRTLKLFCDAEILKKEKRGTYRILDRKQLMRIEEDEIINFNQN